MSFIWLGVVILMVTLTPTESRERYIAANQGASSISSQNTSTPIESPREAALRQVKIGFKWSKGGFGSVMIADFVIENSSNYIIKDLEVTCTHFANSGTQIDSNTRTIYEM
ncbi:MAG: zinc ribbon domain-containing protein, partial [Acidobacteriota bacterium]|nr:zinc ribbon domain-containing protein [Acidobacteriota bacterium]